MRDLDQKPTPLRHHLLFAGLIVGLVTVVAVSLTRFPMDCPNGYPLASGAGGMVCTRSDATP